MAMMATGSSGNPYGHTNNDDLIEQDLIDPDDGTYTRMLILFDS